MNQVNPVATNPMLTKIPPCREKEPIREVADLHPLELFAFFRRWPNIENRYVRILVLTVVFNMLIALFFLLMNMILGNIRSWSGFGKATIEIVLTSNAIGFTWALVMTVFNPLLKRVNKLSLPLTVLSYTAMGFVITQIAFMAIFYIQYGASTPQWAYKPQFYLSTLAISFFISLVLGASYRARYSALERDAQAAHERERVEIVERQAAQANLRALQAQIEPHFLFNTLANVVGLIHPQPDKAKLMLEQFIVYLRATLSATREEHTTLASEFEMMKNFLAILQIRMGDRLQVRFNLPRDLADFAVPPILLQPLVENAIKHGLEPKIDGGEVALTVRKHDGKIAITVADTGLGFQNSSSNGIGLKNVRERVQHLYGDHGSVSIEENQPCGTRITILIPVA